MGKFLNFETFGIMLKNLCKIKQLIYFPLALYYMDKEKIFCPLPIYVKKDLKKSNHFSAVGVSATANQTICDQRPDGLDNYAA